MKIFVIFPTQLFNNIKQLENYDKVFVVEEPIYFTKYKFHKLKLAFHRATMKKYADTLKRYSVKYYDFTDDYIPDLKNSEVTFYDPVDHDLIIKLNKGSKKYKFSLNMIETPAFISSYKDLQEYHSSHENKKFAMNTSFYRWQRNKLQILVPIGSKYELSYDEENRLPFPKNIKEVFKPAISRDKYVQEAKKYVEKHFPDNWGSLDYFIYPIDRAGAIRWLKDFIKHRFKLFGKYEDAIHSDINFGYHSVLSPLLNIGLIVDKDILDVVLPLQNKIPINSFEGYIRQVIGWKQTMRYMYQFHYKKFFGQNFLKHTRKISKKMWTGDTGIVPVDDCIKKIYKIGYLHHIERLMVVGQFFMLTLVNPDDVLDWYISLVSMDAYQWVMYPNVYGMIMYADKGFLMSRPYISSSNYIKKMSNYDKGDLIKLSDGNSYTWSEIWDALYYNLINKHYDVFKKIYAVARNTLHWKNKTEQEKKQLLHLAKLYLQYLG